MRPSSRSPSSDWPRSLARILCDDDAGNAPLEFILTGVLMLVPLFYLIVTLGAVQAQSMGAEAAARHVARALADGSDISTDAVLATTVEQYGIDPATVHVAVACSGGEGSGCPRAGATVTVTVTAAVALPLIPPVLGLDQAAHIPISATAVQKVSTYVEDAP